MNNEEINAYTLELNNDFIHLSAEEVLYHFIKEHKDKIAFSTSLGSEDQVLTHMIAGIDNKTRIFTLDTGRLFQETYDLIEKTNNRYKINIEVFYPDTANVEKMVREKGINLFYQSIENRKLCCHIRKIEPLTRALKDTRVWITGLRSDQSVTRKNNRMVEWDPGYNIIKLNPLIKWSEKDVWDFINLHKIPYNPLHDKGFPSIGCLPCTRAINPGEDIRAGRWWWENPEMKECGLHNKR